MRLWGVFLVMPSSQPGYPACRFYDRCFTSQDRALEWAWREWRSRPQPEWNAEPLMVMEPWEEAQRTLRVTKTFYAVTPLDPEDAGE